MEFLERTKAGGFLVKDALPLAEIERLREEGHLEEKIVPVDSIFSCHEAVTVDACFQKLIDNGNPFYLSMIKERKQFIPEEIVRVYNEEGRFYGIYKFCREEGRFCPVKMFMENGQ